MQTRAAGLLSTDWDLQSVMDDVAAGRLNPPINRVCDLDQIADAHTDMEAGNATARSLSSPDPPPPTGELP